MAEGQEADGAQRRKRSKDRIAEIIDLAERQIVETGALPVSINLIAEEMGVSRALVYAYFSDQNALVDAVVDRAIDRLRDAGLDDAIRAESGTDRALAAAAIYYDHIVATGPVLHHVFRDAPRSVRLSEKASRYRGRLLRALAGALGRELDLPVREAILMVEMLLAIPEELARLVRRGELSDADGAVTCRRLLLAGIDSLRPAAQFQ